MLIDALQPVMTGILRPSSLVEGEVVDDKDPKRRSRVKVKLPGLTDEISKDDLPWYHTIGPGQNYHLHVPAIGTRVLVQFFDDYTLNPYDALVLGSIASVGP